MGGASADQFAEDDRTLPANLEDSVPECGEAREATDEERCLDDGPLTGWESCGLKNVFADLALLGRLALESLFLGLRLKKPPDE